MKTSTRANTYSLFLAIGWLCLLQAGPAATRAADLYAWTTIAGDLGYGSADGTNSAARFKYPGGVAIDTVGNMYVTDSGNHTIRKLTRVHTNWISATIAGQAGSAGCVDGTNGDARFNSPVGIAVDGMGNLFVADGANNAIRKVAPQGTNWVVTTIAGSPFYSGSADGTNGDARFNYPCGVTVSAAGEVFVADTDNSTVRMLVSVGTNWVVTTIAGSAPSYGFCDGTNKQARFFNPSALTIDAQNRIYVADTDNNVVRRLAQSGTNWVVNTVAGMAGLTGSDDGTNSSAHFCSPLGITVDSQGQVYVSDSYGAIRRLAWSDTNCVVITIAGVALELGFVDGTNADARFQQPFGLAVDSQDNLFVADYSNNSIRQVAAQGTNWVVSTLAGRCSRGSDDGVGATARFSSPAGVAIDRAGNVYIADSENDTIRKLSLAGTNWMVSTIAGSPDGLAGGNSDGLGREALFHLPYDLSADEQGNILVVDTDNSTIRQLAPMLDTWMVTTPAGQAMVPGFTDGTGGAAQFRGPLGIAVDSSGVAYIADAENNAIRSMAPSSSGGVVTTIAGLSGIAGTNDGPGVDARFNSPFGVAVDSHENLYVADFQNKTIRKLTRSGGSWEVSTIAGQAGVQDVADGTNSGAHFCMPSRVAVDSSGTVYVTDAFAGTIRKLTPAGTNWVVSTIGGQPFSNSHSDGLGTNALFSEPWGIAVDYNGNLYVADMGNNIIRIGVPQASGSVQVTISPTEAVNQGAMWCVDGGSWQTSGNIVSALPLGTHTLSFVAPWGWIAPDCQTVVVSSNQVTAVAVTCTMAPAPDLAPVSLQVPANVTTSPYPFVTVVWGVTNQGVSEASGGWYDAVYLSTNATMDGVVCEISESEGCSTLSPASCYWHTNVVSVPVLQSGSYYLIIMTDAGDDVFESNEDNNTIAAPITINLTASADLSVAGFNAPHVVTVGSPAPIPVAWAVTNVGQGLAAGEWWDLLTVSTNLVISGHEQWGTDFFQETNLAPGAGYLSSNFVTLPTLRSGLYYLLLQANTREDVYEENWQNNTVASPLAVLAADDLALFVSVTPNPVPVSTLLTLTARVANAGPSDATGVYLTNTLPAGVRLVSATCTQGAISVDGAVVICNFGLLTNGAMASATIVVQPLAESVTLTNVAVVTRNEADANPLNNIVVSKVTVCGPPPPNDDFANRATISGGQVSIVSSNVNATAEPGEPPHADSQAQASVWWAWTAPANGSATISTEGSSFDTVLSVYTGTALTKLSVVAEDDDSDAGTVSLVTFRAQAGVTYVIAVDGFGGDTGSIRLSVNLDKGLPPANDDFANRIPVMGVSCCASGSNLHASKESQEPDNPLNEGGASVWWSWTAPANGMVTIDTIGSEIDTILAVYAGNSLSQLTLVDCDDDSGGDLTSQVNFAATVGSTYQIAVDGFDGASGNIVLNLEEEVSGAPSFIATPHSQVVAFGACARFSGLAVGDLPISYQWRFNGKDIPATRSTNLDLMDVQFTNAGRYALVASNFSGVAVASALLTVGTSLNVAPQTGGLRLDWTGSYALQTATNVNGPFVDVPGAVSPFTNLLGSDPKRFFRLRSTETNSLRAFSCPSNVAFAFSGSGVTGYNYVVQASTNLKDWVCIETNAVPFRFVDPVASNYPARFYRTFILR